MIGVEMVENPVTRKPMEVNNFIDIWERCKDMGVLFGKGGINGNVRFYLDTKFDLIKFNFHFLHPIVVVWINENHLFNHKKQVFRIKPPMCITKEDAKFALEVFEGAVKNQLNN